MKVDLKTGLADSIALPSLERKAAIHSATMPVPKLEEDGYDWWARHQEVLDIKGALDPELVLIGDSITHGWGGLPATGLRDTGERVLRSVLGQYRVLNLGFGWDRTQNVLWRLDQGEIDGLNPKAVVINIGTNNTSDGGARINTAQEIRDGIDKICERVRFKLPKTRAILMAIFPREPDPAHSRRILIDQTNALLADCAGRSGIDFVDITSRLLGPTGDFLPGVTDDFCHLTENGYQIWAEAIAPLLCRAHG